MSEKSEYPMFLVGETYSIEEEVSSSTFIDVIKGTSCRMRYEGQDGRHYVFRETRGGWTRTYTRGQLAGKIIHMLS